MENNLPVQVEKKYTFFQRIQSDTPIFFKRAQRFGAGMAGVGIALTQVHGIPDKLVTGLITAGTSIAAVSQFAVKQCEPLNNNSNG